MKKSVIFILLVLALVFFVPFVSAKNVNVGLYVVNLGKFDISTGAFTADFYLTLRCDEGEENCTTNFEFSNGRATIDKIYETKSEVQYRILANLNSQVDLRSFPFDHQKMQIILEDKLKTVDDLKYVPLKDESGIDKYIAFTGWNIDGWNASESEHYYPVYNQTYSQYLFSIDISKIWINSFFKTFMPVLFIMMIVMFSFLMDPDKLTTRLGVATSSLIAAAMFHISISNQIPPVGYLTSADKFMILTYFILLTAVVINIFILELSEKKNTHLVEKVHRITEYNVLIAIPLLYLLFFIFFV